MLLEGQDAEAHRRVARRSCIYAGCLLLFFLVFGNLVLRIFAVPLSMVRMVGGIVLIRIGFALFMPSGTTTVVPAPTGGAESGDVAFVPLAMPIMFGPGAVATVIGYTSLVKQTESVVALLGIVAAIVATMAVTCVFLVYAQPIMRRVGPRGIDACSRLVGFFVSAMGMALVFHGLTDVLQGYGVAPR